MPRQTNAELIAELRRLAHFENASFGHIAEAPKDAPLPTSEKDVTGFIKERTRVYRKTWTDQIINEIERRLVKSKPKSKKRHPYD